MVEGTLNQGTGDEWILTKTRGNWPPLFSGAAPWDYQNMVVSASLPSSPPTCYSHLLALMHFYNQTEIEDPTKHLGIKQKQQNRQLPVPTEKKGASSQVVGEEIERAVVETSADNRPMSDQRARGPRNEKRGRCVLLKMQRYTKSCQKLGAGLEAMYNYLPSCLWLWKADSVIGHVKVKRIAGPNASHLSWLVDRVHITVGTKMKKRENHTTDRRWNGIWGFKAMVCQER